MCFHQNLVLVAEYTASIVNKHCCASAVTNFQCHKLIVKVNGQKNSNMQNFICNPYGETFAILNTENVKICGLITKLEAMPNTDLVLACDQNSLVGLCMQVYKSLYAAVYDLLHPG